VLFAGAASGFATSTKYNAAVIALAALVAIFLNKAARSQSLGDRVRYAALFGCTMAGAFVLASPFSVLDFREFRADVIFETRHLADGHGVILGRGWSHHVTSSLRYGVGLPLLVTGTAGMFLLIARDRRKGILVAIFPLSYYLLIGRGYTVFARYIIPVVPFLCLTTAYAVSEAAAWMSSRTRRASWSPAFTSVIVLWLAWPSVQSVINFNRLMARTDSRALARAWVEEHIPPGRTIAQLGMESGHVLLFERDPSEAKYAKVDLGRPGVRPDVVIVNSSPLPRPHQPSARELRILSRDYQVIASFNAFASGDPANIYDWQDDFFLPLTGFKGIERPGPNVTIYVRR
jgi:hypothetical protein